MKKVITLAAFLIIAPMGAMAAGENNVGSCGWGSKLFDGQSGVFPQALAGITNGTFGNQTFGVSSGTSGCTQDGAVSSSWQTAMFIDGNKRKLARDMAIGQGETLDSLAALIGVEEQHKDDFYRVTRENFAAIFPSNEVSVEDVRASLRQVVSGNAELVQYSVNI